MFLTYGIAQHLSWFIVGSIAYLFVTIFSGYMQALIAKKLGDPTAEYAGFLTLNPLVYIDWLGFALFLIYGFGWGTMVPIDPYHFRGKYKRFELVFIHASRPIVHCLLIFIMLTIMVMCFGGIFGQEIPMLSVFARNPELTQAIRRLIIAIVSFALFFMVYTLLMVFVRLILFYGLREITMSWQQLEIISLIMAFFMIYFYSQPLMFLFIQLLAKIELFIWHWWSALATITGFISFYQ